MKSDEAILAEARDLGFEPATARTLALLGHWAIALGHWARARELLEDAFLTAQGVGDEATAVTAAAEHALALADSGDDLELADLWARLAQASVRRAPGSGRLEISARTARARVLEARGRYEEAAALYQQTLDDAASSGQLTPLGEASQLLNLGASLDAAGHPARALASYERALELADAVLGPGSAYAADVHTNLGLTLTALGRYDEAMDHLRRAMAAYGRVGAKSKQIDARLNLGIALGAAGRLDEARAELEAVRASQVATLGPDHDDVGLTDGALGWVHGQAGRHPEAAAALARAREIHTRNLGPDHPEVLKVTEQYAAALAAAGRAAQACAVYRELLELAERAQDPDLAQSARDGLAPCPAAPRRAR